MKKYILRVISYLGFALIRFVLKSSLKKRTEYTKCIFECAIESICDLDHYIFKLTSAPVNLIEINGPDLCDFMAIEFDSRIKLKENKVTKTMTEKGC